MTEPVNSPEGDGQEYLEMEHQPNSTSVSPPDSTSITAPGCFAEAPASRIFISKCSPQLGTAVEGLRRMARSNSVIGTTSTVAQGQSSAGDVYGMQHMKRTNGDFAVRVKKARR